LSSYKATIVLPSFWLIYKLFIFPFMSIEGTFWKVRLGSSRLSEGLISYVDILEVSFIFSFIVITVASLLSATLSNLKNIFNTFLDNFLNGSSQSLIMTKFYIVFWIMAIFPFLEKSIFLTWFSRVLSISIFVSSSVFIKQIEFVLLLLSYLYAIVDWSEVV